METWSDFSPLVVFLLIGAGFAALLLVVNRLLAPDRPNPEKNAPYECGEEPQQGIVFQFNSRIYVVGLVFLIFEVELLFIFPWIASFSQPEWLALSPGWGWLALIEMGVFVVVLLGGLAYAWVRGDLDWVMAQPQIPGSGADTSRYEAVNRKYAGSVAPEKSLPARAE